MCVSLQESHSCSIEDEEHREVQDSLTAAGTSFFCRWLGLIIRIKMPIVSFHSPLTECVRTVNHVFQQLFRNVMHPEEEARCGESLEKKII